ncbi:hypothetical protein DIT68_15145 [Brumimicrobium oceani]|uniref:Uncharacterized protein n=1 Tax=Brumimicrobium oceani TaxID=2100725 RepID=A0A2U2X0Q2_9FLAO|nr:hypothetical protein DIT68_15145 [Brumimicrobium oceani]
MREGVSQEGLRREKRRITRSLAKGQRCAKECLRKGYLGGAKIGKEKKSDAEMREKQRAQRALFS